MQKEAFQYITGNLYLQCFLLLKITTGTWIKSHQRQFILQLFMNHLEYWRENGYWILEV